MATSTTNTRVCKTLIDERPWDDYDLESLLPLKETYRENDEFGFLLRHYWIPATELRFRQSLLTTAPAGKIKRQELRIDRRMARCRSNECTWREWVRNAKGNGDGSEPAVISEMLCSYDCYDQTYVSAEPILFALPTEEQKTEARRQSLYRLPMLCPPGPVPIGFTWYAKVGDDYMNFRLQAEHKIGDGETSVLVVRREGRYTAWHAGPSTSGNGQEPTPMVVQRQGVTLFAWNRGAVLEDRFLDKIIEIGGQGKVVKAEVKTAASKFVSVGTTCQSVTRLARSCPTEVKQPVASPTEKEPG